MEAKVTGSVLILGASLLMGLYGVHQSSRAKVYDVLVTGKERITTENGSKYLVFTDGEVFENVDNMFLWKFNSSDVYGQIHIGDRCTFEVNLWRIHILSAYRNILSATCSRPN